MKLTIYAMAMGVAAAALTGCQKVEPQAGTKLDTNEVVGGDYTPSAEAVTAAAAEKTMQMTVSGKSIDVTSVSALERPAEEVYFYADVKVDNKDTKAPAVLSALIDSLYTDATDQKVVVADVTDMKGLAAQLDSISKNFKDSVATDAVLNSVTKAFNVTFAAEPVTATDTYTTYKVYTNVFTGGAHPVYNVYYLTISNDGNAYDFDSLITNNEYRVAVKEALVKTIAQSKNLDVEKYLAQLNEFLSTSKENEIGVENFPVYNVGITEQGLVFSYPEYSIDPASEGVQLFALPIEPIANILTLK